MICYIDAQEIIIDALLLEISFKLKRLRCKNPTLHYQDLFLISIIPEINEFFSLPIYLIRAWKFLFT